MSEETEYRTSETPMGQTVITTVSKESKVIPKKRGFFHRVFGNKAADKRMAADAKRVAA